MSATGLPRTKILPDTRPSALLLSGLRRGVLSGNQEQNNREDTRHPTNLLQREATGLNFSVEGLGGLLPRLWLPLLVR